MALRQRPAARGLRPSPLELRPKQLHDLDYNKIHASPPKNVPLYQNERVIIVALTGVTVFTRFFRLSQPSGVVFDEAHFGNFVEKLLNNEFAFDIHPWLGKLTLAFFAWLARYRVEGQDFTVGKPYVNNDYYAARVPSALFGSGCIPLMYLICRELHISISSSVLGAILPLFDNLLTMESRYILIDSQLMFYLNLTLLCALRLWNLAEQDKQGSTRYFAYLVATAASCAAAMSVKWTAAATPFLIAVVCGLGVWFLRRPTPLLHCALAAVVGLSLYIIPWYFYVKISTTSTKFAVHMGDRFRSTLHGNETFPYNPDHNVTFVESFYELHWRQFRANQKVKTRHHWESKWYEWPLNMRGMYFYVDKAKNFTKEHPVVRQLYLIQNPAGALWVFAAVVSFMVLIPVVHRYRTDIPKDHPVLRTFNRGSFLLTGYLLNLLPYMLVERCYFMYHYLPALTYGQILLAFLVDTLPMPVRNVLHASIASTVIASFIFWSPWTYCFPVDIPAITRRQWMPRWN